MRVVGNLYGFYRSLIRIRPECITQRIYLDAVQIYMALQKHYRYALREVIWLLSEYVCFFNPFWTRAKRYATIRALKQFNMRIDLHS